MKRFNPRIAGVTVSVAALAAVTLGCPGPADDGGGGRMQSAADNSRYSDLALAPSESQLPPRNANLLPPQPAANELAMQAPPTGETAPTETVPTEPAASKPEPNEPAAGEPPANEPAPGKPAANEPAPGKPAPSKPAPGKPAPSKPAPGKPAPNQPAPGKPAANEPAPSEPAPSEPAPQEPAPNKPAPGAPDSKSGDKRPPEPLFVDWPQPRAVLVVTGQQHGYIEPCGCTGLSNQKGGLARRHTLLKQLESRGWATAPLDLGNQVRRLGPQAELKYTASVRALKKLKYQAVTFGPDDLRLSAVHLFQANSNDGDEASFVCANASLLGLTAAHRVIEVGGLKIGVTGVVGDSLLKTIPNSDELTRRGAAEGLDEAWQELQGKCDYYVLLAHAPVDESKQLAARHPFDLLVTTGLGEPTRLPEKIAGAKTDVVQVGVKGMYAGVIGIFSQAPKLRYQRVPLDDRFEDSPQMLEGLQEYQASLQKKGLFEIGAREILHPSGRMFAGSQACADCHSEEFAIWKKSPHAHATDSIVNPQERAGISRHFDPECLSCHVTGWNAQKFFPYKSGYLSLDKTPLMKHNGCENCHGPAAEHVAAENEGAAQETLDKLRAALHLTLAKAEDSCLQCHDLDNSPDFHKTGAFLEYWNRGIAH